MSARKLSDAQLAEAKRLRKRDAFRWSYAVLARRYGVNESTMKARFAAEPNTKCQAGLAHQEGKAPISRDEYRRRLSAAPPDTRDLTARFFGDPPFWRSALAQRGHP